MNRYKIGDVVYVDPQSLGLSGIPIRDYPPAWLPVTLAILGEHKGEWCIEYNNKVFSYSEDWLVSPIGRVVKKIRQEIGLN